MTSVDVRVAEIAARAEAASMSPWKPTGPARSSVLGVGHTVARYVNTSDAEFIAHARDDIPFLLSEVRRLRSVVEDAERVIAEARRRLPGPQTATAIEAELHRVLSTYQAGADHE